MPHSKQLNLIDHIKELRKRLASCIVAVAASTIIGFYLFDTVIQLLYQPFNDISSSLTEKLIVTSLFEGFTTKLKLSVVVGLLFSLPVILYQAIRFIFPGLKRKEKVIVALSLGSGSILAIGSIYLSYFKLLPFSIQFLTSSQFIPNSIGLMLNYEKSIFFVFNIIVYSMIIFQFPIILELFLYLNIVKRKTLLKASRYVIVGIFILTALITPPDVITQIGLALPLICLYFLTILIAKWFNFGESYV